MTMLRDNPLLFLSIILVAATIWQFCIHLIAQRSQNQRIKRGLVILPYLISLTLLVYSFIGIVTIRHTGKDLFPNFFKVSTWNGDADVWLLIAIAMLLGSMAATLLWSIIKKLIIHTKKR